MTKSHLLAAKRIMRYIKNTQNFGILYGNDCKPKLSRYVDSDLVGNIDHARSTTKLVISIGTSPISWLLKKTAHWGNIIIRG